jgi:trehalose 6-phosphate phosphatase
VEPVTSFTGLLEPLVRQPDQAGLLFDFDGVLSPIVEDPDAARPLPGVVDALRDLAGRYALVGVLSGRPVDFLAPLLPEGMVISGLYGLEVVQDGTRHDHPTAGAWREAIEDVVRSSASRGPEGMRVEPKGLSLTLHYRSHPELADAVREWAETQAARSGLVVRSARMSVELHPPIEADKGTALDDLADELRALSYVGDDVGDLPAFGALDRLSSGQGVETLRVAVASDEAPAQLLDRADLVLHGPGEVLDFLHAL